MMGMISEITIEANVETIVKKIKDEIRENKDKPEVIAALKKMGRFALTLFEWSAPDWVEEYKELFRE